MHATLASKRGKIRKIQLYQGDKLTIRKEVNEKERKCFRVSWKRLTRIVKLTLSGDTNVDAAPTQLSLSALVAK